MEFREGEKQAGKKKIKIQRQVNDYLEGKGLVIKINHLVPAFLFWGTSKASLSLRCSSQHMAGTERGTRRGLVGIWDEEQS